MMVCWLWCGWFWVGLLVVNQQFCHLGGRAPSASERLPHPVVVQHVLFHMPSVHDLTHVSVLVEFCLYQTGPSQPVNTRCFLPTLIPGVARVHLCVPKHCMI